MPTLQDIRGSFEPRVIQAGDLYFHQSRVRMVRNTEDSLHAIVTGTMQYDVHIDWDDQTWRSSCTCPYAESHDDPCKHVWATLRAAEARGWISDDDHPASRAREGAAHKDEPRRHAIWRRRLTDLRNEVSWRISEIPSSWPADKQIVYILYAAGEDDDGSLKVHLASRVQKKSGRGFDAAKQLRLLFSQIPLLPEAADRQLISMLCGAGEESQYNQDQHVPHTLRIRPGHGNEIVRLMCQTGRCLIRDNKGVGHHHTLVWEEGEPWHFHLAVIDHDPGKTFSLRGLLKRADQTVEMNKVALMAQGGPVVINNRASALADDGAFYFTRFLRAHDELSIPVEQTDDLVAELLRFPRLPELTLPESMKIQMSGQSPKPRLRLHPCKDRFEGDQLDAEVHFDYGQQSVSYDDNTPASFDATARTIVRRDLVAEGNFLSRLTQVGFRRFTDYLSRGVYRYRLAIKKLPFVVRALTTEDWRVEVDGKVYRQPGKVRINVSSGIDWFEVNGQADFDGVGVSIPALLKAVRKGESTIVLDDGTLGILPETWIKRYGLLAALGEDAGKTVQFAKNQIGLLDALMAEMPEADVDETFARARKELRSFAGIGPIDPPSTFIGELRPYQRDGLGWMKFLRNFGLNGCLADDMGLGKTVQVLALLEERRLARAQNPKEITGPSLVVVPRSLVFNWHQEATRFAPQIKVLDHATVDRQRGTDHFKDYDLILTTYGTLRNDITALKDIRFDYVILDEAQAIKNANSESAKAARLVRSQHRMVLSGTPVQNHLGELWSLFEFLNPGMLGASRAFANISSGRTVDPQTRDLLAAALRPFVLRRTKEQVAKDLPEKFEQTIFCELEKPQRKLYDELKQHYRQSLMTRIAEEGLAKSKIHVLEALLRLRQAACHPALLDKTLIDDPSAKLDTLIPRLAEVVDEGHKAIVFSQFTSFLAIVRKKLDDQGQTYEYLDGKTRDRQEKVERFQNDPNCKLFLISLKAGGLGLNLTAAQYVFLLDPWWNPAIEAQAVDRAHRIGQTRQVFAYRLIARDTVEEKVLQLQQTKRELADAIINADNAILSNLGKSELELLLS